MRCLFCKADSSSSRSVEHVVPESLGNTRVVLPPGVVCDACNNYFARKIEQPFLESPALKALRFHQVVANKRGRVPSLTGAISPGHPAQVTHWPRQALTTVAVSERALADVKRAGSLQLFLPAGGENPPDRITSRFLAKVALEAMAERLTRFPEGLAYLCEEAQLDPLRDHARLGNPRDWPFSARTIYHPDAAVTAADGRTMQVTHESDFLVTPQGEWYFVLAIFGLEFAINIGGPFLKGYESWLRANNGLSPLYSERNGGIMSLPR